MNSGLAMPDAVETIEQFEAAFSAYFAATPGTHADARILISWIASPVGPLVAGAMHDTICLLEFGDRRRLTAQLKTLSAHYGLPLQRGDNGVMQQLRTELDEYFAGRRKQFDVAVKAAGTPFQERVWQALLEIPCGETRSYEDIARRLGALDAIRAVGTANGRNRLAILVPCHRVINKSGQLGGYGGGLPRKQFLLDLESPAPRQAPLL